MSKGGIRRYLSFRDAFHFLFDLPNELGAYCPIVSSEFNESAQIASAIGRFVSWCR